MHIILIDDTPDHLELLAEFVRELRPGARITTIQDGRRLPEVLAEGAADLLLMDLIMPGVDGISLARRVRETLQPSLPIVAVSGLNPGTVPLDGSGINDQIGKPFSFASLSRILDRYVPVPD